MSTRTTVPAQSREVISPPVLFETIEHPGRVRSAERTARRGAALERMEEDMVTGLGESILEAIDGMSNTVLLREAAGRVEE